MNWGVNAKVVLVVVMIESGGAAQEQPVSDWCTVYPGPCAVYRKCQAPATKRRQ